MLHVLVMFNLFVQYCKTLAVSDKLIEIDSIF